VPLITKELETRYQEFLKRGDYALADRIKTRTEYDIEMLKET